MPHWVDSFLRWLSQHWGDVVPAWLAVIAAIVFGVQQWWSRRPSKNAERGSERAGGAAKQQPDTGGDGAAKSREAHKREVQHMMENLPRGLGPTPSPDKDFDVAAKVREAHEREVQQIWKICRAV